MIRKSLALVTVLSVLFLSSCSFSTAGDVVPPTAQQVSATRAQAEAPTASVVPPEPESMAENTTEPPLAAATEATAVEALGTASLSGRVINPSGGEIPVGQEILLRAFVGMEISYSQTTLLSDDGTFLFEDLELVEDTVYIITVDYQGMVFGSDVIPVDEIAAYQETGVEIDVYDQTTDQSALYADRAHIFFDFISAEQVQVVVYLLVSNPTDRVIAAAGEGEPVLSFMLPTDATNLQFEDSGMSSRYVSVDGGFGDLMTIRPGMQQHEVLFAYDLPFNKNRAVDFTFPVEVLSGTIVAPEGMELSGNGLEDAGQREMDTGLVTLYAFENLPVGETLEVEVSGSMPGVSEDVGGTTTGLAIGLGVFAVVLVLAGFWLRRKPKQNEEPVPVALESPALSDEPQPLTPQTIEGVLDAIVELDQAYEVGQISEKDYTVRRAELKEKLRELRG